MPKMKESKSVKVNMEAYELAERFAESDDRSISNAISYLIKKGYAAEKEKNK